MKLLVLFSQVMILAIQIMAVAHGDTPVATLLCVPSIILAVYLLMTKKEQ